MLSRFCQKCPDCGGRRLPGVAVGGRQTGLGRRIRPPPPASTPRGSTPFRRRLSRRSRTRSFPGAVVLVGRGDRVLYEKAIGQPRARAGGRADDARHDLRPRVADQGRGDDDQRDEAGRGGADPAERSRSPTFIPGFERYGKADITIRHLLTHTSGLRPDLDLGGCVGRLRHGDRAGDRGSADVARPASGSSTATSTTSCSATSSGA